MGANKARQVGHDGARSWLRVSEPIRRCALPQVGNQLYEIHELKHLIRLAACLKPHPKKKESRFTLMRRNFARQFSSLDDSQVDIVAEKIEILTLAKRREFDYDPHLAEDMINETSCKLYERVGDLSGSLGQPGNPLVSYM